MRPIGRHRLAIAAAAVIALWCADARPASTERPDAHARALLRAAVARADSFQDRFDAEVWLTDMTARLVPTMQ